MEKNGNSGKNILKSPRNTADPTFVQSSFQISDFLLQSTASALCLPGRPHSTRAPSLFNQWNTYTGTSDCAKNQGFNYRKTGYKNQN